MRIFFTSILLAVTLFSFGQAGPDNCSGATNLVVNADCMSSTFDNDENGTTDAAVTGSCATGGNYSDVWYSFTGTGGDVKVTLSGTNRDGCLTIWNNCSYTTQLGCVMVTSGSSGSIILTTISGTTYYIQIQRRSGTTNQNMNGSICVEQYTPPSNDDPCSATAIPVNTTCTYTSGSNIDATVSSGIPAPGCGAGAYNDVWFTLTVPASGSVIINTAAGSLTNADMAIYSAASCSGPFTLIECDDLDGPGNMPYISRSGLTAGSTLYISIWGNGGSTGTFDICAVQPPVNDNPCQAVSLTVNTICTTTTGTNTDATATISPTPPAPGCGNYLGGDVWYSVVVPASGSLIINTTAGTLTDGAMAIYSGATCSGTLTLIECDDDDGAGFMPYIYRTGLTVGSTIWIRVWGYGGVSGTFDICVTQPPANDNQCSATTLPVSTTCSYTDATNLGATYSTPTGTVCGSTPSTDVWFSITVPASGNVVISTEEGTLTDAVMAVYSGTLCTGLTYVTCNDDLDALAGFSMPLIYLSGRTPGETLWIRVWGFAAGMGTFGICALETFIDPDDNQDCVDAERLCGNASFNDNSNGTGSVADLSSTNDGCLLGLEHQSAWYAFRVQTSGTLSFSIDPVLDNVSDYDFAIWGPTTLGSCPPSGDPIRCSWALGVGPTGLNSTAMDTSEDDVCATCDGWVAEMNVLVGEVYYMVIDNYTPTYTGFDISFGGTGEIDCLLPVSLVSFTGQSIGKENLLHWVTASETNNSHFELEKSYNGLFFDKFGTITGAGNSTEELQYVFKDKSPYPEVTYYRLKQYDYDGHFAYSKVIAVTNSFQNTFKVFPNPTANGNITITYSGYDADVLNLAIFNTTGQQIFSETVLHPEDYNQMQYQLPAKGIYVIVLTAGEYQETRKIMY